MVIINVILLLLVFVLIVSFSLAQADIWSFISILQSRIIFETGKRRELELRIKELENDQKG